jgi:hypothetical protein
MRAWKSPTERSCSRAARGYADAVNTVVDEVGGLELQPDIFSPFTAILR